MSVLSSWNGNLPTDVELDSGVLYIGASIFSAQDGGIKFDPGTERRQIPFDGQRSNIAGLDRTTMFKPVMSGTIMEVPYTAVATLEPGAITGAVSGGPSGATQVSPKVAGVLYATGDYIANVRCIWQRGDGSYVQVRFPKAYCAKWDKTGKDKDEAKYAISFEARLDMAASGVTINTPPYVIEYFTAAP